MIKEIINKGEIVPVIVTVNLLKKAMEKAGWASKKFLVDGFPRNQDNYDGWQEVMGEITDVKFVLFLECAEKTMIDRV
jgi:UMP-CMP kinase